MSVSHLATTQNCSKPRVMISVADKKIWMKSCAKLSLGGCERRCVIASTCFWPFSFARWKYIQGLRTEDSECLMWCRFQAYNQPRSADHWQQARFVTGRVLVWAEHLQASKMCKEVLEQCKISQICTAGKPRTFWGLPLFLNVLYINEDCLNYHFVHVIITRLGLA